MSIDHINFLRNAVASEDDPNATHDLRLCGVDAFECILHSDATKEQKIEKLNELNELYLTDKDSFDEGEADMMEDLMTLLAEFVDREPKKPTTYE